MKPCPDVRSGGPIEKERVECTRVDIEASLPLTVLYPEDPKLVRPHFAVAETLPRRGVRERKSCSIHLDDRTSERSGVSAGEFTLSGNSKRS
jgi:hypothetical protein